MSYQRLYPQRINWEDEPSLATPINQVNLNKMDAAIYGIDGRVVELDENKVGKTETFNTSRNGVVPKPTQADITNEKVLRADGVWVEQSGGGGGGGGHTYVDKNDEQMPPRGKAKFTGGLNLTDDSENNRTIVDDNYEIIPWTTWKEYTDAQKAQHPNAIVTGAPDCDGTLEIENMHLAWTNPDPTASTYGPQPVTLDTDDYDGIEVQGNVGTARYRKGSAQGILSIVSQYNSRFITDIRPFTVSGNTVNFLAGYRIQQTSAGASVTVAENNGVAIPLKIYTFKDDLTAKIKAIAHDVSTSASKCMMSDEQTSVEDRLADSGWKTLSSSPIECKYRKYNGVVYVYISARNATVQSSESLGTLPVGYRPSFRCCVRNSLLPNNDGYLEILDTGVVTFTSSSAGSGRYIHCCTSYPADN